MKIGKEMITELKNKEYRDAFVASHVDLCLFFQVQALRKQRGWTQKELTARTGIKQEKIAAIDNPDFDNVFTLPILKQLASVFDIGLIVRFAPISQLVDWDYEISPEILQPVSFNEDPYFEERE